MQSTMQKARETSIALMEDHAVCRGERLTYRLCVHQNERETFFSISVTGFGESCSATAGNDLTFAVDLFHKIVRGSVTPCVLDEVLRDGQAAESGAVVE